MHFHVHWSIIYNTQGTIWKQPKRFHTHNRLYIYIHTIYIYILYVYTHTQQNIIQPLKKEGNPAICDNMDEPRGHYVK